MSPETFEEVNRIDPGMISYIESLLSDQNRTDVDNGKLFELPPCSI
jgi:hypothetical protein